MKTLSIACIAAALSLAGLFSDPASAQQSVQIAAAANLTKIFTEHIIPTFTKKTAIVVLPTYGATGLLARQMESGAPYQVFVSADLVTPQNLGGEGLLDPKSVKTYAVGQLALWSNSVPVASQGLAALTSDAVKNIAVANPKTAPYGAAAMETLTKAGLLDKVQSKIVYAENISQAYQYTQSGNTDAGFTALSLVQGSGGSTYIVPASLHAPIAQAVGVIPGASEAAKRFAGFLLSKECRKIFTDTGYLPPSAAKR